MPRPKNKTELIDLGHKNYEKLLKYVDSFSAEEVRAEFPQGTLNRNIRDVLAHLHHWHLMVLDWYKVGMAGDKPEIPGKGYTWRTLPGLNKEIQEKYSNTDLKEVRKLFDDTFNELQKIGKTAI